MALQPCRITSSELVEGNLKLTRYFPAAPVQNSLGTASTTPNGGAESYVELAKAINTLGDFRLSTSVNSVRWANNPAAIDFTAATAHTYLQEYDFDQGLVGYKQTGAPVMKFVPSAVSAVSGDVGSQCFCMAIDLETSNGLEISGLNAEEQSDISLIARFSQMQGSGFAYDVFTHIDSMIVLKENNVKVILTIGFRINSVKCMFYNKMGELNPVYEYIELCLDSWDSSSSAGAGFEGSSSPANQIQYSWPQFYFNSKKPVVAAMKVISAEIPFVFDVINSRNNTFVYTIGGVPTTITIPVGTYTGTSLATQLQTLLAAVTAGMTVTWSDTTLRFTFTQTISAVAWSLTFGSRLTPYSVIGFLPNTITSAVGVASTIVSPTVASVTGPYYLYLNSRTLGSMVNFNLPDGAATGAGPELCRIPINVNFGSVIFYNDPDPEKYFDFFIGNQITTFDFYLTLGSDQYQKPLDMKGAPWSLKIGMLCYRDATTNLGKRPASMMRGENSYIK